MFGVVYAVAVLLALLAQTSPLLFTVGPGLRVDVTLVMVVYVSLFWHGERALIAGFLTGLGQDTLSSDVLGLHAFSKSLAAFVVHTLSRHVQSQSLIAQVVFTCLAVLVDTLAHLVVMVVFQLPMLPGAVVVSTFMQQTFLSMLLAPCVCYVLQRAMHYGRVRQDKG